MANPDGAGLDSGDVSWTLMSTALVLLMTPALAFFYGAQVCGVKTLEQL